MSINTEEYSRLIEDDLGGVNIEGINTDIIEQKKKINKINKLTIANLVISSVLLLIMIIMMVEYNIILQNFNGFPGVENFINNATILVDKMTPIVNEINQTEGKRYLHDAMFLINMACESMNCSSIKI